MIMYHLGPQLGVWIMQVSTFSSVLINRFHCTLIACTNIVECNPHLSPTELLLDYKNCLNISFPYIGIPIDNL